MLSWYRIIGQDMCVRRLDISIVIGGARTHELTDQIQQLTDCLTQSTVDSLLCHELLMVFKTQNDSEFAPKHIYS